MCTANSTSNQKYYSFPRVIGAPSILSNAAAPTRAFYRAIIPAR
jgi:hypothetical protein